MKELTAMEAVPFILSCAAYDRTDELVEFLNGRDDLAEIVVLLAGTFLGLAKDAAPDLAQLLQCIGLEFATESQ